MTEEQRAMFKGLNTFMNRIEYSFRKEKETLKKLRSICDQAYYDIVFDEIHNYDESNFNVFNIRSTEQEKQELSHELFKFHDEYQNNFADYFDESDDLENFMYWYNGLYKLIDEFIDRW